MSASHELVKGPWSVEEDNLLLGMVQTHGPQKWSVISGAIPGRTAKSCRLRWCNQLSPELNHQPFTPEEDRIILQSHAIMGTKWATIARMLNGRTDNSVKNRWHGLKKKLAAMNEGGNEEEEEEDSEKTESNCVVPRADAILKLPAPVDNSTPVVVISDSETETQEFQVSESTADPNLVLLINQIVNKAVDKSISTVREEMGNNISGIVRKEMGNNIAGIVSKEIIKYNSKLKKD